MNHRGVTPSRPKDRICPTTSPRPASILSTPSCAPKGYDDPTRLRLETPAPVDIEGPKGRRRKGPGRTDYLICIEIGAMPAPLPVGLIEAKREAADPLSGMEQGKGYGDCRRFSIHYVFATNGHRYGEFNRISGLTTGPHDFDLFPTHAELVERYARDTGIDLSEPAVNLLFTSDSPAYAENPRYYRSAAIRAVIAKILHCERDGQPARALLVLATGSGKTIVAANLLHRLNQAGRLAKPALFLCDRDELRQQALGKLRNVFKDGARIVTSDRGENSARNARIQIATYQTLGLDDDAKDVASFLTRHYPEPNSFSVIIIDECHRSAWNRWRVVLERNPNAIQIGLTATPRELREPKRQRREDQAITANNLAYFGPPVYEYDLIQAQEDGYLAACEIVRRAVSLDGETFTDAEVVLKKGVDIRTGKRVKRDELKPKYNATRFDNDLVIPERIAAMCKDLFEQLCANGGPEQKVIVFCTRDLHADRVAMQLNNRYAECCKTHEQTPKDRYAFKCTEQGGSELIETFRGSGQRCFIACTVDLLATGVDIERLNAVCFFRYLDSAILFYQMVGRSTAGAGVKTNLLFFTKGRPTERIWYYDLSGMKVGKKQPMTLAHFGFDKTGAVLDDDQLPDSLLRLLAEGVAESTEDSGAIDTTPIPAADAARSQPFPTFARLLASRGTADSESPLSWTLDIAARREKAREEMAPHLKEAARQKALAITIRSELAVLRRAKAPNETIEPILSRLSAAERAAREAQAKADAIDAAVFDLKAVNPRARSDRDNRTPEEVLTAIAVHQRTIDLALKRLQGDLEPEAQSPAPGLRSEPEQFELLLQD